MWSRIPVSDTEWVLVIGSGVAAKLQVPERGEGAVHAASESERPVPQVVAVSFIQHDHVHQAAAETEKQVQRDVTAWQVIHADQSGVFPPDLQQLQATFLCSLQDGSLSERQMRDDLTHLHSSR